MINRRKLCVGGSGEAGFSSGSATGDSSYDSGAGSVSSAPGVSTYSGGSSDPNASAAYVGTLASGGYAGGYNPSGTASPGVGGSGGGGAPVNSYFTGENSPAGREAAAAANNPLGAVAGRSTSVQVGGQVTAISQNADTRLSTTAANIQAATGRNLIDVNIRTPYVSYGGNAPVVAPVSQIQSNLAYYVPISQLGGPETQARILSSGMNPGQVLAQQMAEATARGDYRGAKYYQNELDKYGMTVYSFEAAEHQRGIQAGIPTGPNRYEYAGDLAIGLLKGVEGKGGFQYATPVNLSVLNLPGGMGLQGAAWERAMGRPAPSIEAFYPAINKLAAVMATGQTGPYNEQNLKSTAYVPGYEPYTLSLPEQQAIGLQAATTVNSLGIGWNINPSLAIGRVISTESERAAGFGVPFKAIGISQEPLSARAIAPGVVLGGEMTLMGKSIPTGTQLAPVPQTPSEIIIGFIPRGIALFAPPGAGIALGLSAEEKLTGKNPLKQVTLDIRDLISPPESEKSLISPQKYNEDVAAYNARASAFETANVAYENQVKLFEAGGSKDVTQYTSLLGQQAALKQQYDALNREQQLLNEQSFNVGIPKSPLERVGDIWDSLNKAVAPYTTDVFGIGAISSRLAAEPSLGTIPRAGFGLTGYVFQHPLDIALFFGIGEGYGVVRGAALAGTAAAGTSTASPVFASAARTAPSVLRVLETGALVTSVASLGSNVAAAPTPEAQGEEIGKFLSGSIGFGAGFAAATGYTPSIRVPSGRGLSDTIFEVRQNLAGIQRLPPESGLSFYTEGSAPTSVGLVPRGLAPASTMPPTAGTGVLVFSGVGATTAAQAMPAREIIDLQLAEISRNIVIGNPEQAFVFNANTGKLIASNVGKAEMGYIPGVGFWNNLLKTPVEQYHTHTTGDMLRDIPPSGADIIPSGFSGLQGVVSKYGVTRYEIRPDITPAWEFYKPTTALDYKAMYENLKYNFDVLAGGAKSSNPSEIVDYFRNLDEYISDKGLQTKYGVFNPVRSIEFIDIETLRKGVPTGPRGTGPGSTSLAVRPGPPISTGPVMPQTPGFGYPMLEFKPVTWVSDLDFGGGNILAKFRADDRLLRAVESAQRIGQPDYLAENLRLTGGTSDILARFRADDQLLRAIQSEQRAGGTDILAGNLRLYYGGEVPNTLARFRADDRLLRAVESAQRAGQRDYLKAALEFGPAVEKAPSRQFAYKPATRQEFSIPTEEEFFSGRVVPVVAPSFKGTAIGAYRTSGLPSLTRETSRMPSPRFEPEPSPFPVPIPRFEPEPSPFPVIVIPPSPRREYEPMPVPIPPPVLIGRTSREPSPIPIPSPVPGIRFAPEPIPDLTPRPRDLPGFEPVPGPRTTPKPTPGPGIPTFPEPPAIPFPLLSLGGFSSSGYGSGKRFKKFTEYLSFGIPLQRSTMRSSGRSKPRTKSKRKK